MKILFYSIIYCTRIFFFCNKYRSITFHYKIVKSVSYMKTIIVKLGVDASRPLKILNLPLVTNPMIPPTTMVRLYK